MLKDFLKVQGVVALGKEQQKGIIGGIVSEGNCRFTLFPQGGGPPTIEYRTFSGTPEQQSSAANLWCVDAVGLGWARCYYDCDHDN